MDDVAIIGVGLHPFGRFGDKTAFQMGAEAVDLALDDAGVAWPDVQFAFGGSWEVAQTDPLTGLLGLTGIPFMNVFNACATAASAIQQTANAIRAGVGDIGVAVGLDKHPRGSFKVDPTLVNMPMWYADNGQYVTTKFFGMKINRYMHDHGISSETLAKVAAKNYRNGSLNPKAFRRKAVPEEEILAAPMLNHPLTASMFCAPDEGAAAVVMCRADIAHRYTDTPVFVKASADPYPQLRRLRGQHQLGRRRGGPQPHGVRLAGRVRAGRHRTRGRRRHPAPGHRLRRRDHPHGRERLLRRRRAGEARRRRSHRDRRPHAGQHRRRADRQRRADRGLGPAADARARAAAAWSGRGPAGGRSSRGSATPRSTALRVPQR